MTYTGHIIIYSTVQCPGWKSPLASHLPLHNLLCYCIDTEAFEVQLAKFVTEVIKKRKDLRHIFDPKDGHAYGGARTKGRNMASKYHRLKGDKEPQKRR